MIGPLRWAEVALAIPRNPGLRSEAIAEFRDAALRRLLRHAATRVPRYQRLFANAGILPEEIRGVAELNRLPISSRRDVMSSPREELLARGIDPAKLVVHRTSGSTGQPAEVLRSPMEERLLQLFRLRATFMLGARVRDRSVRVTEPFRITASDRLRWSLGFMTKVGIDCRQSPEAMLREIERVRPDLVTGLPSVLALLASRILGGRPLRASPRMVITGGEPLIPPVRGLVGKGFAAPVADIYGAHECNLLAWECCRTGLLHVCDDAVVIEILDGERPVALGEHGEVVITALHSHAMPFIRYRLGDSAMRGPSPCPCGLPFSTISAVEGRMIDILHLPGGRTVQALDVAPEIRALIPWVESFEVVQTHPDRIEARVVPRTEFPPGAVERLRVGLAAALAPATVSVEVVPELVRPQALKHRWFRSEVASIYEGWNTSAESGTEAMRPEEPR